MVLLENFGAEPFTVQFNQPNRNNFVPLLPRNVVSTMMLRIPKSRKENYPERADNNQGQFFDVFSGITTFPFSPL
jgi:hypothetical protein